MDEVVIRTKLGKHLLQKFLERRIRKSFGREVGLNIGEIKITHEPGNKLNADLSVSLVMSEAEFSAWMEQLMGG